MAERSGVDVGLGCLFDHRAGQEGKLGCPVEYQYAVVGEQHWRKLAAR